MRPRIGGRSRRRGLRAGVPAGAPRRAAGPRHAARGTGGADAAGQRHGGEQRDRRGAGYPGARGDRQAGGRAVPHRHRAGDRQDPARPDRLEGRSGLDQRPQDLRAEGRRRAVCPPPAARAAGAAVLRRRPGARAALRHAARPADRRPGRGLPAGAGRNGGGGDSGWPDCATTCWTGCARRSRVSR